MTYCSTSKRAYVCAQESDASLYGIIITARCLLYARLLVSGLWTTYRRAEVPLRIGDWY